MNPEISIYLQPYSAVYIEIPKVACSSLKILFAQLLDIDLSPYENNPHLAPFPAPPTLQVSGTISKPFYFAMVRNPWDRLLSCYRDKIAGEVSDFTGFDSRRGVAHCLANNPRFSANMSFADFVLAVADTPDAEADVHFRSQHSFIYHANKTQLEVDFVGRFENLHNDFKYIANKIALPDQLQIPHRQAAKSPVNYQDYYTRQTQQIVAQRFSDDITLFNYHFAA